MEIHDRRKRNPHTTSSWENENIYRLYNPTKEAAIFVISSKEQKLSE
jgi:hypothetical protein